MAQVGRQVLRAARNYARGYSDTQIKVRTATSNEPWGPSGNLMAEIAQLTYNHRDFVEIMEMIDKRLNDHGKNWRHVFKALTLLDYLLHSGSEAVISYARENAHVITTLKEFIYIDDDGKDQGANVRQKSKDIAALLADEARLRDARRTRHEMRGRFGVTDTVTTVGIEARRDDGQIYNEDRELQRALEESRRTAEQEQQSRKAMTQEEIDIQKAIELSEKEQIERLKKERDQAVSGAGPSQGDNLIDIFGSLDESPQPLQQQGAGGFDPFAGFGNVDPFQQQQMQQQMLMQQQQQLQAQLQQQQMMQMQLAGQGNPFGMGMQNTGGMGMQATGGMGQQQQQQPMQNQLTGDMNAMARGTGPIDPFASLAARTSTTNTPAASNPFGQQLQQSSDPFSSLALGISSHSTGGNLSVQNTGFGGGAGVRAHSTGGYPMQTTAMGYSSGVSQHHTGGYPGFGGVNTQSTGGFAPQQQQQQQQNMGSGYNMGMGMQHTGMSALSQQNTGSFPSLSQQNTGPQLSSQNTGGANAGNGAGFGGLVNLDASSLTANKFGTETFGNPFGKPNPFGNPGAQPSGGKTLAQLQQQQQQPQQPQNQAGYAAMGIGMGMQGTGQQMFGGQQQQQQPQFGNMNMQTGMGMGQPQGMGQQQAFGAQGNPFGQQQQQPGSFF